jgi:hypothetical protein
MAASLFFGGNEERPLSRPEDVIQHLGKREAHWKARYSAYETAHSWFAAHDVPPAIRAALDTDQVYADARLRKAVFEKKTVFDELTRSPSQTDVLAILEIKSGLAVLGVEGKVRESFDATVNEWNDFSPARLRRLAGLVERLRLAPSGSIGMLRYQLLHRTVATLVEAKEAGAHDAVVLVQSFNPDDVMNHFDDFQNFATALGAPVARPGMLSRVIDLQGVRLQLGWTVNPMKS